MRTRNVAWLIAAMIAAPAPAHPGAGLIASGAGGSHWSWGLLRLPLLSFHARSRVDEAANPLLRSLRQAQGWSVVGFAMPMLSRGCYLKVTGSAEFDRAEVVFADGELRALDLRGARRGKGIYELVVWHEPREIVCLRIRARARSDEAQLQLLLRD